MKYKVCGGRLALSLEEYEYLKRESTDNCRTMNQQMRFLIQEKLKEMENNLKDKQNQQELNKLTREIKE